jgi:ABC-type multidrug transport system permease subunit
MYWIEEYTIQKTNEFLSSEGKTYSKNDEINQRNQIKALWKNALPIEVKNNTVNTAGGNLEPLTNAMPFKWYFALSVFYLFIGSVYFIDIKKTGIVQRLELCGAKLSHVILGSLMPSVLIVVSGFILVMAVGSIFAYTEFYKYILLFIAALFYLISFAFISAIIVLLSNNVPSILILASTFTFINAVLSELVIALPQWAVFLRNISVFLPGKWVNVSINQIYVQGRLNAGIFICAFVYAVAYFVLCYFQERKKEHN